MSKTSVHQPTSILYSAVYAGVVVTSNFPERHITNGKMHKKKLPLEFSFNGFINRYCDVYTIIGDLKISPGPAYINNSFIRVYTACFK